MYTVIQSKKTGKALRKAPKRIQQKFLTWLSIAEQGGPDALQAAIAGFKDEALGGVFEGYRSSRLSHQYRVIYRVQADVLVIEVINVTAHDYRRK